MSEQARRGRRGAIGCVAVLVVVLAVIVGVVVHLFNAPRHQVATSLYDFNDLCGGRPIPGAPAYTPGSGEHPMAVFSNDQNKSGTSFGDPVHVDGQPLLNARDVASVQLVACTDRADDGQQATTCDYQGTSVPMYRGTVTITVYEARTAEQVGQPITITADDLDCPFVVSYTGAPEVHSMPTEQQYADALTPFAGG